jgi:hypothetical protein
MRLRETTFRMYLIFFFSTASWKLTYQYFRNFFKDYRKYAGEYYFFNHAPEASDRLNLKFRKELVRSSLTVPREGPTQEPFRVPQEIMKVYSNIRPTVQEAVKVTPEAKTEVSVDGIELSKELIATAIGKYPGVEVTEPLQRDDTLRKELLDVATKGELYTEGSVKSPTGAQHYDS